jgi:hypothetical protein
MKIFKTLIAGGLLALLCGLIYDRIVHPPEEWQTRERCKACDALEDEKLQVLKGTVEIGKDGKMVFQEQKTKKSYALIPCDINCDNTLVNWFEKMEQLEDETPVLYSIEGKLNAEKQEFSMLESVLIN